MRIRTLSSDSELTLYALRYADCFRRRSNGLSSTVSVDYLRRCKVRGIFDDGGAMVGGYAIGTRQPLRLTENVPEEQRDAMELPKSASWDDFVEVVCIWRTRRLPMARIWSRIAYDCLTAGRPLVLGYTEIPGLDDLYTRTGAETLFHGISVNGVTGRLFFYRRRSVLQRLALFLATEAPARLLRFPAPARASRQS